MTVRSADGIVHLEGICPVEDAEPLLAALLDDGVRLDVSRLEHAHFSLIQIIAAVRPAVIGAPREAFLADLVLPAARAGSDEIIDVGRDDSIL